MDTIFVIAKASRSRYGMMKDKVYAFRLTLQGNANIRINTVNGLEAKYEDVIDFLGYFKDVISFGELNDEEEMMKLATGYKCVVLYEDPDLWP